MVDLRVWQIAFGVMRDPALSQQQAIRQIMEDSKEREEAHAALRADYGKLLDEVESLKRRLSGGTP